MDYTAIRDGYRRLVPLNSYLGLDIAEIGPDSCTVHLPDRDELKNHVATQHAGAMFTAGEAASGGAFLGAFAERLAEVTPLAEKADIAYRKIARGPITAVGRFAAERDAVLAEFDREGRLRFPVEVELTDPDGEVVAEMTVQWYVRKKA